MLFLVVLAVSCTMIPPSVQAFSVLPTRSGHRCGVQLSAESDNQDNNQDLSDSFFVMVQDTDDDDDPVVEKPTTTTTPPLNQLIPQDAVADELADPLLRRGDFWTVSLLPHRPLGCTIEESLPDGDYVFVSKVTPGGLAEQVGLQVGDVVVACSDYLDHNDDDNHNDNDKNSLVSIVTDTNDSMGSTRMETVLTLIRARPESDPLVLRIARGCPAVLEQHEQALVSLCSDGVISGVTTEIENCMLEYLQQAYVDDDDTTSTKNNVMDQDEELCNPNEDDDCVLDNVFELWNQDLDVIDPKAKTVGTQEGDDAMDNDAAATKPKVKPWSSRSSPSGTFVRDPVTGKMTNLDA